MWDLSSLTRDQTQVPCIVRWILYHWTTRKVPCFTFNSVYFYVYNFTNLLISYWSFLTFQLHFLNCGHPLGSALVSSSSTATYKHSPHTKLLYCRTHFTCFHSLQELLPCTAQSSMLETIISHFVHFFSCFWWKGKYLDWKWKYHFKPI